jgi:hypothetical protein
MLTTKTTRVMMWFLKRRLSNEPNPSPLCWEGVPLTERVLFLLVQHPATILI